MLTGACRSFVFSLSELTGRVTHHMYSQFYSFKPCYFRDMRCHGIVVSLCGENSVFSCPGLGEALIHSLELCDRGSESGAPPPPYRSHQYAIPSNQRRYPTRMVQNLVLVAEFLVRRTHHVSPRGETLAAGTAPWHWSRANEATPSTNDVAAPYAISWRSGHRTI